MLDHFRYNSGHIVHNFVTFQLSGSDVESFVQNQSTLDYQKLADHHFSLVSFLDPQGRLEFYSLILKEKNKATLLIPSKLETQAISRLERFLISEDVEIKNLGIQSWYLLIGPESDLYKDEEAFQGQLIEELTFIQKNSPSNYQINHSDFEKVRKLNGWPDLEGSDFQNELLNNLRLYDLSLSPNKGCYPGQETVSKIATRRGAAYAPVLLKIATPVEPGEIFNFDRKIGFASDHLEWNGEKYLTASILRDFRVQGMNLNIQIHQKALQAQVVYYPLLSGKNSEKSKDLFFKGAEEFRLNNLEVAEKYFRKSISLDPACFDAYEALGVMLGRQERFLEAIEVMKRLSEVDPQSVMAHTNLSLFYMRVGKIEEAEQEKSHATIKSFQKFGEEAKFKEEKENYQKQQESEWIRRESMFRQVLEIDPDDTLANYGLGAIYVEKSQWQDSLEYLEKVLKNDEQYSVAYLALGKAYLGLKRKEDAKKVFEKGILVAAKKGDLMPANQMQAELSNL